MNSTNGKKKTKIISNYRYIGLLLFVGIPLPFTGAWTGCFASHLLGLSKAKTLISIFLGLITSSIIIIIIIFNKDMESYTSRRRWWILLLLRRKGNFQEVTESNRDWITQGYQVRPLAFWATLLVVNRLSKSKHCFRKATKFVHLLFEQPSWSWTGSVNRNIASALSAFKDD